VVWVVCFEVKDIIAYRNTIKFKEKVDEYTLALLYLVIHEREEGFGARAWKGFDWDTMNRLYEKGLITNPVSKARSVGMTEQGFKKSENLFKKYLMGS
jgi:hypothetical protein